MNYGFKLIDFARKTSIVDHYNWLCSFKGTQDQLVSMQRKNLIRLLLHLRVENCYYSSLLKKFSKIAIEEDPFRILQSLPLMDKCILEANRDLIFSALPERNPAKKKTGGSTGTPFTYWLDSESVSMIWGYTYYCWHKYADYCLGDPYVTVAGKSMRVAHQRTQERVYNRLQNNYVIPVNLIILSSKVSLQFI